MQYQPSPLPTQQIHEVPIVVVALPHDDIGDSVMIALRQATVPIKVAMHAPCTVILVKQPTALQQCPAA